MFLVVINSIIGIIVIVGFIVVIFIIRKMTEYEEKIEKIYKELDENIRNDEVNSYMVDDTGRAIQRGESGKTQNVRKKLEELKRKRQYLLDKLPFIKK
jgi:hypothetical protein